MKTSKLRASPKCSPVRAPSPRWHPQCGPGLRDRQETAARFVRREAAVGSGGSIVSGRSPAKSGRSPAPRSAADGDPAESDRRQNQKQELNRRDHDKGQDAEKFMRECGRQHRRARRRSRFARHPVRRAVSDSAMSVNRPREILLGHVERLSAARQMPPGTRRRAAHRSTSAISETAPLKFSFTASSIGRARSRRSAGRLPSKRTAIRQARRRRASTRT